MGAGADEVAVGGGTGTEDDTGALLEGVLAAGAGTEEVVSDDTGTTGLEDAGIGVDADPGREEEVVAGGVVVLLAGRLVVDDAAAGTLVRDEVAAGTLLEAGREDCACAVETKRRATRANRQMKWNFDMMKGEGEG